MVILSLLMLFVMPNIINYIKKGGDTKDTVVKTLVYDAASKYIDDNKNMFKQVNKNTYCISLYTLASEGYVESPVVLSGSNEDITSETSTKSVKVTYDKKYKYELTDECTGIVNPTPVLTKGLTPVVYDEEHENWVVVSVLILPVLWFLEVTLATSLFFFARASGLKKRYKRSKKTNVFEIKTINK